MKETKPNRASREIFSGWAMPLGNPHTLGLHSTEQMTPDTLRLRRSGCTVGGQGEAASVRREGDVGR